MDWGKFTIGMIPIAIAVGCVVAALVCQIWYLSLIGCLLMTANLVRVYRQVKAKERREKEEIEAWHQERLEAWKEEASDE